MRFATSTPSSSDVSHITCSIPEAMKSSFLKLVRVPILHPTTQPFTIFALGKDATEAFEDVGHSDEARALLPGMLIGEFEKGENVGVILLPILSSFHQFLILT